MNNRNIQLTALALGVAGALAFGQAHASGFQLKENSVKAMGRAFAGSGVATGDASVVVNNPATMTSFEGTTFQADVTIIDVNAEFSGSGYAGVGLGPLSAPLTGGNGGDVGEPTPVPAMSLIHKFNNGLTVGAMVSAPFGLKTEYDEGWVGRYSSTKSEVKTVDFTLSAAYEIVPDRFSVGVGLVYERAEATLENSIDFGTLMVAAGLPGARPQGADGAVSVQGDDYGFGYILGLNWRPVDSLAIGLSHRSEIDHELRGTASFDVPSSFGGAQAGLAALAANPLAPLTPAQRAQLSVLGNGFRDTGATAPLTTPSITSLSIAWQVNDNLALMGDFAQTDWHSVKAVDIDFDNPFQPNSSEEFDWSDTRFWSIGAEYKLSDTFTLRGGYAYDETPTTFRTRTTRLPDEDRRWYSLGLGWNVSQALEVNLAYTRIEPDTPKIGVRDSSRHVLFGEYSSDVNLFGLSAQYRF